MLAAPKFGFVFLAAPKAGSTAIQRAFTRHAQLVTPGPPSLKHVNAVDFEADFAPLLAKHGYPRSSYVTTCLVREPIDRTVSWWRYRSRQGIADTPQFTGNMSFAEFAEQVVSGEAGLTSHHGFAFGEDGQRLVDRPFRYEHIDRCIAWMAELVGKPVKVPLLNVSPGREVEISPTTRAMLEEFFATDLAHYELAE